MKKLIKAATMYRGVSETNEVRLQLVEARRAGLPYCPPDEGDFLYRLAQICPGREALEVGFATGSTAAYMLLGLGTGRLTSVDYKQDRFDRDGERLLAKMHLAERHTLLESDSIHALPTLLGARRRFGLVFLDGWKTFDHIWVDTFYCARMLLLDGYIVFDDARMPAVRKCISLLEKYYGFQRVDAYAYVGGWRQRIWHLLSTRSPFAPYVALKKMVEIHDSSAGRRFDFWQPF